jgi:predicted nucleic acid-binding protein
VSFLLDTNAVSELSKEQPDPRFVTWMREHDHECFLSAITIGELVKGLELLPEGKKQRRLSRGLRFLQQDYKERILPYDELAAIEWGRLYAAARKDNRTLPLEDSLIEAIAVGHSLTVVTRKPKDFYRGRTLDPWTA